MQLDPMLTGEPLAIDLANTAPSVRSPDLLRDPAGLAGWLQEQRPRLGPAGVVEEHDLAQLIALRSALRDLLAAAARHRQPSESALAAVNHASALVPQAPQLNWPAGAPVTSWTVSAPGSYAVALGAACARSAIELLAGPGRERVRRCPGPGCERYFVASDPRRRWCSSRSCGNRVRVARHAARLRGGS